MYLSKISYTSSFTKLSQHTFKLSILSLSIAMGLVGCNGSDSPTTGTAVESTDSTATNTVSTSNVLCNYSVNEFNSSASVNAQSTATWSCDSENRNLTANGIPNHEVGTFPNKGNPNTISTQNVSASLALKPTMATNASRPITIGYALNGVKVEPGTGGSCGSTMDTCVMGNGRDSWRIEALGQSTFDFGTDMNNAHVQPTGQYHYHGMPERLIEKLSPNNDKMVLVAWAMDGYPIYARYGYAVANDAKSSLVSLKGSYQLKTTAGSGRISVDELPLGTFAQDYEYVAGSGDLDECNGRTGVTPEFPNGTYYYMISDSYPFAPRCLKGTVANAGGAGGPQGGRGAGGPQGGQGNDVRNVCQALKEGPQQSSEHGPMDNADLNKDGTVYREELESFMNQGEYRRVTILTYFDRFDTDKDGKLSDTEFAQVNPSQSFDGTDANGDCIVTREEVIAYANEEGRSYRKIGLEAFFDLVDTNNDNKATPEEIEAAHESGLLARY